MLTEKFYTRMTELAGIVNEAGRVDFLKTKFKEWADGLYKQVASKEKARTFTPDEDHPEGGEWLEQPVAFPGDIVAAFAGKLPVKAKYDKKLSEIFEEIINADPLPNKQNSQWLIKLFTNNLLKLEDLYKATNYLTIYEKVKQAGKIPVEQRDINKFKSLSELYDIISKFENVEIKSKSAEEREEKLKGADKIYEDSHWLVITPKTREAACLYGMETQWCTAASQNNYFQTYSKQGPLYILFDKTIAGSARDNPKKKLQFHFETKQFMDARDHSIKIGEFLKENRQLISLFDKLGKLTASFKLEHKLLEKDEVMKLLRDPKQRVSFVKDEGKFGAKWLFDYLAELGETEEIRKIIFDDEMFLKELLSSNKLPMLEYGFSKIKKADKQELANFLVNNKLILDFFGKHPKKGKEIEEYLKMIINSGPKGEDQAQEVFINSDILYNIMRKHKELVDYYNILQKGVFGAKGTLEAINRMEKKNSKYRQEYISLFGDYSAGVMVQFLKDVYKEKAKKKSLEESFSVGAFKEQFIKEGQEYLKNLGFVSGKTS